MRITVNLTFVVLFLLSHGMVMANERDIISWENIKLTRFGFYEALMLNSLRELRERWPGAVATRFVVLSGWGEPFDFTLMKVKEKTELILVEIKSTLRLDTIYRVRISKHETDFNEVSKLMNELMEKVDWKAPENTPIGDDVSIVLFEWCGPNDSRFIIKKRDSLPDAIKEAISQLEKIAQRHSDDKTNQ